MPEKEEAQQQTTYPMIQFQIAMNGIIIETFFSPMISVRAAINEEQANALLSQWLKTRQQVQAQNQLITDVMRNKLH